MIKFLLWPFQQLINNYRYKKRLKELRKRDPFIYK